MTGPILLANQAPLVGHRDRDGIDLSIVVTVFNDWPTTKACLASILASARDSTLTTEIILADDCSTDETPRAWRAFTNKGVEIQYRCNDKNLGYLRNANAGAKLARGRYICLMNNDIVVTPGWADRMVATLESEANIGLVGPKFLDRDGNTQETGVAVYSDGVGHQLGVMTHPDDRRFAYLNDVHYCTMACAITRTDLFRELGGYDERYAPAYYEDVDFCFRLFERGLRIVVDPTVHITHAQGAFYGGVQSEARLNLMEANRKKFQERWASRLEHHHPRPGVGYHQLRSWARGETILFVWPTQIDPRWTAGGLRNWILMSELRKLNFHIVCVAPWATAAPEDAAALRSLGIEYYDRNPAIMGTLQELVAAHRIKAVVLSFVPAAQIFTRFFTDVVPEAIRIFDTVDLMFLRELRAQTKQLTLDSEQHDGFTLTSLPESASVELSLICQNDLTLVVSEAESQVMSKGFGVPKERLCVVSTIHDPALEIRPFEDREGFSFIGYGKHEPNVDAIEYLASDVWPTIRSRLPTANLYIYGSELPPEINALHDPEAGFHVIGFVRDHREALQRSRVMLAPLRFGAGVKGKIGESLAVGTVTVTTPVGAEGMDSTGSVIAVGETVEQLADLAVTLHERQDLWEERSQRSRGLAQTAFSGKQAAESLINGINRAIRLRKEEPFWQIRSQLMFRQSTNGNVPLEPAHSMPLFANHSALAVRVGHGAAETVDYLRNIQNRPLRWAMKLAYWTVTGRLRQQVTKRFRNRLNAWQAARKNG